ncbi:energy transducer TonB [Psychrobium sp. 1_MG-2023]|uniref:energy transducer TonB n=1 Tax=Psychrobium sp. 1_MG-2023 TaxID=3062624 RepID=UPI000C34A7DF|nr:energy transducer TonB [Psychrobium sp. 1_MG-2023]MDP2560365.1 energy transducer TonB [Psychrobium sp. 1_MG-2023]PKF55475.1 hypothetical protein CW748_13350 [Alteromonadales bacterium alter-6D02]
MNRYILGIVGALTLAGCNTTPTEQFQSLQLTEAELLSKKWANLERFPPLYPIEEARARKEGCASVEYVITPDNEIKDIKVVSSTSKYFAKQAKLNVKRWKWSELAKGITQVPIKTNSQFQFCLETGDGHCSKRKPIANNQCTGDDIIYATGYVIKRGS